MSAEGGLWYVKMPDGDVEPMTLDDLDEAFNADRIDENVMVLPAGQTQWARLGGLLGLDAPATPPPVVASAAMPNSLRPVSLDLSGDLDLDGPTPFKPRSRKALYGVIGGALALGVVIFAASRGGASAPVASAASAPPVVAAAAAAPPAAAPAPPPVAATAPVPEVRFDDAQKAKLLAADKARDDKAKARKKARGAVTSHPRAKYKSQGFTTGGNKFDPLNANP